MKKLLSIGFLIFSFVFLTGQTPFPNSPILGTAQYAVAITTATSLTVPSQATYAVVCVETQAARYTVDTTTPTASTGMPIAAGSCIALQSNATINRFQIIQQAASATIDVTYYR